MEHKSNDSDDKNSAHAGTRVSISRKTVIFKSGKELNEQELKKYSLIYLVVSILLAIIGIFTIPLGIVFIISGIVTFVIYLNYKRHRTDLLNLIENYESNKYSNEYAVKHDEFFSDTYSDNSYHEKIEKEHKNNSIITESDISIVRNKPFSLSGKWMFDCGIPYFYASSADETIIKNDIKYLIDKAIGTGVIKTYKTQKITEHSKIRTDIYTSTKKIKKFPVSVYVNDGITFFTLFYTQRGELGKADLTYCPDNKKGYTISYKTYSGCVEVRRICSYPIGGGSITELYCRK